VRASERIFNIDQQTIEEDMDKSLVPLFFWLMAYIHHLYVYPML